jgi:uncharacterized damage-inducible protein DinB
MQQYFKRLFAYNAWANKRLLDACNEAQTTDHELLSMISHLLIAQEIWACRIAGTSPQFALSQVLDLASCEGISAETNVLWNKILDQNLPFETTFISYKNLKGEPFETSIVDIAAHVANHSTYHRAQAARVMRILGYKVPVTDFIAYSRL